MNTSSNHFNIVLSSSGFNDAKNEISDDIIQLFKQISTNKKVMILANAAPFGTSNYIAREKIKNNFLNVGASQVDICDLDQSNISSIQNYDIVYGLGGDVTYLINLNKDTNLKEEIIKFLKHGIYIGESAGSMILSDDLNWVYTVKKGSKPKYDVVLETYEGLGLTQHYIFPHDNKMSDTIKEKAKEYENTNGIKFTRLRDGEFITEQYIYNTK